MTSTELVFSCRVCGWVSSPFNRKGKTQRFKSRKIDPVKLSEAWAEVYNHFNEVHGGSDPRTTRSVDVIWREPPNV